MDTNRSLKDMGFELTQGQTRITKKSNGFYSGDAQVVLTLKGITIYEGNYGRGIGLFPDLKKEPQTPDPVFSIEEHEASAKEATESYARLESLAPTYSKKRKVGGLWVLDRSPSVSDKEFIDLINGTLARGYKQTKLTSEFCSTIRIRSALSWYDKRRMLHESMIKEILEYRKEHAKWEKHILGLHVAPCTLSDVVYSAVVCDATDDTFEDWCDALGYNNDSIKDKNVWRSCRHIKNRLNEADADIELINLILQDH
tara:strand:- start:9491 stop:10258 length:768 start_codon:yes stop_codon:yes gene_type:complete